MKHCTNCGFDIKSNERICPHCGYQFSQFNTTTYDNSNIRTNFSLIALIFSIIFPIVGLILVIIAIKKGEMNKSPNRGFLITSFIILAIRVLLMIVYFVIIVISGLHLNYSYNTSNTEDYRCKYVYTCTSKTNNKDKYVCLYKNGSTDTTVYCSKRYDIDEED